MIIVVVFTAMSVMTTLASASDAVLMQFVSRQCSYSQKMQPTISALARRGVPVRTIDVETERRLAMRHGVRSTPTFIVRVGSKEVDRLVGFQTTDTLTRALQRRPGGRLRDTSSTLRPANNSAALQPAASGIDPATARQRAANASVRLRVHDGYGYDVGSGTIIDSRGNDALVLTCGHIFRTSRGEGKIEVDVFQNGQTKTVAGQLLAYHADQRDIAVVAISPGGTVPTVPVVGNDQMVRVGQSAFSYGCNHGETPSLVETRLTGKNKYNQEAHVSNLEIETAP
ncbi:MAG: trypsin-like peptidase domain-containing protein, partial [Planctomycetota bacterium]